MRANGESQQGASIHMIDVRRHVAVHLGGTMEEEEEKCEVWEGA